MKAQVMGDKGEAADRPGAFNSARLWSAAQAKNQRLLARVRAGLAAVVAQDQRGGGSGLLRRVANRLHS